MDNREVEMDIQKAFDQVSLEEISKKLEDVDPFDFQCPTELSKKRIEKDFMRRLNESNKKKTKTYKKVAYTAAALAVVAGATFTFGDNVRAAIDKMFGFVPNQGVVEVEVDNTADADTKKTKQKDDTQSAATQDGIYVLKEKAVKDMPNFAISMESANIMNGKMKMIYKIDLKAVREATIDEEGYPVDLMVSTFKSSGMEKYCDYNEDANPIVKKVHSSVVANGKELQPSSSEVRFGEDSNYDAYVIEEYALEDCNAADSQIALKVGDVEMPLSMETLTISDSVEGAVSGRFIAKNVGVTLLCDTEMQDDGWVYADIYVLDSGKYKAVDDVWPYLYNSDELTDPNGYYPTVRIGGQRFEGCCVAAEVFDGRNGMPYRLAFEVGNDADMSKLTIFLSSLMVEKADGEVVRLDNDFVFGAEAANNKEQSPDEAVEVKWEDQMNHDDSAFYDEFTAELTQEEKDVLSKYEKQYKAEGLFVEHDSTILSVKYDEENWRYKSGLFVTDTDDGNNTLSIFVCPLTDQELKYYKEEALEGMKIENTEYGFKCIKNESYRCEYHADDHVLIIIDEGINAEDTVG